MPRGLAGTVFVVGKMRAFARGALFDERVNMLARRITQGIPVRDAYEETRAVLSFLQQEYRYTRLPFDPEGFQRLQTVPYTLLDARDPITGEQVYTGECASLTTAGAALLMSIGNRVVFRTVGRSVSDPDDYEHVYWLTIDAERGVAHAADPSYNEEVGWEPSGVEPVTNVRDWQI